MGYIKFVIKTRLTNGEGRAQNVRIARMESSMGGTTMNELPFILHALAIKGRVQRNQAFAYTFPFTFGRR